MDQVMIERIGGLGGFGGPGSRLSSRGAVSVADLSDGEKRAMEDLFRRGDAPPVLRTPDGFLYRITRETAAGPQTVEAPEDDVPAALRNAVRDELR